MPDPVTAQNRRVADREALWNGLLGLFVFLVALQVFGRDLIREPHFVDEAAYHSQTYYADLFFQGAWNDPAWLEYPALDLPPLPKYLFGLALRVVGEPRRSRVDAYLWYNDIHSRVDNDRSLIATRWVSAAAGAVGCAAIYGLGLVWRDRRTGLLAAFLLAADSLYRMHARRAMADALTEALALSTLFVFLAFWKRTLAGESTLRGRIAAVLATGFLGGLAVLAKLNGALALMIPAVWSAWALIFVRFPLKPRLRVVSGYLGAGCVSLATFIALNPTVIAHPARPTAAPFMVPSRQSIPDRLKAVAAFRIGVSSKQQAHPDFKVSLLATPAEKIWAVAVHGFGRYALFGPPRASSIDKVDWRLDWGCFVWGPIVLLGAIRAAIEGRSQYRRGLPPTAWAILAQAVVALVVVTIYIPLAWNRYFLPLQSGSSLLAAGLVVGGFDRLARRSIDPWKAVSVLVFATLFLSYAFYWHSRDWNTAGRLMLTYAAVDRGTIRLDGLENQTGDKAIYDRHYYLDKTPGFSFLAAPVYWSAKTLLRLPAHPLHRPGKDFAHWPADYWVTLGTSGLLSALTGVLLLWIARELGCGPRRAALVALAYGLATPAYVYATLSVGHQPAAFALLSTFWLLWVRPTPPRSIAAGFLAATAAAIEPQVAPIAAILGFYLIVQWGGRRVGFWSIAGFALGAIGPLAAWSAYNLEAFGGPFEMGYFHHADPRFASVHSSAHPLGLREPDWSLAGELLVGRRRGLIVFAPIVVFAPLGWAALFRRGYPAAAVVSSASCSAMFLVNLSYPEWTGGWSTGPRLLTPLLPFALIAVAGVLSIGSRAMTLGIALSAAAGAVLMLLFQATGGRISQDFADPIREVVWPIWSGAPLPPKPLWPGDRFDRNAIQTLFPNWVRSLPADRQWLQFVPLAAFQGLSFAFLLIKGRARSLDGRRLDRVEAPAPAKPVRE